MLHWLLQLVSCHPVAALLPGCCRTAVGMLPRCSGVVAALILMPYGLTRRCIIRQAGMLCVAVAFNPVHSWSNGTPPPLRHDKAV